MDGKFSYNQENKFDFKKFKGEKGSRLLKSAGIVIGAIVLLFVFFNLCFFTVDEREQAVVTQFSKVIKIIVSTKDEEMETLIAANPQVADTKIYVGKGLYFKIPFLQSVTKYTSMLLTFDTSPREVITKDKKILVLDNYAQWKIVNPALFTIKLKTEQTAHTRLDDVIYSKLNEEIGKVDAITIISDKDFVSAMLGGMIDSINVQLKELGIEVVDIRIKKTELPEENYEYIYNRMSTERQKAATEYRSKGLEDAQKIKSAADMEATIIEAEAYREAEQLKGEGDAEALKIYAEAYNKDPEFFAFWRTLQAYKEVFTGKTTIVLDKDSEFVKYFYSLGMEEATETQEETTETPTGE
jgi:modulator of FtsH protease HflC